MGDLGAMLAFVTEPPESAPREVRVNFGLFAGREATAAEIDELAAQLLPKVGDVSIVREERHEISGHSEAAVQLVRIELPSNDPELAGRVVQIAEQWAENCIADRHAEVAEL